MCEETEQLKTPLVCMARAEEPVLTLSMLEEFGTDLTKLAEENKLDPVVGRKQEIERVARILCKRGMDNPCLIGDPGVGKSSVVKGLAQLIIHGNVSPILQGKKVFSVDVEELISRSSNLGEFKECWVKLVDEVVQSEGLVILFINKVHNLFGAGAIGHTLAAAYILKSALIDGKVKCIGETTIDEYMKYMEKYAGMKRCFQLVEVPEPTEDETISILGACCTKYAKHHNIQYPEETLKAATHLSKRYVWDRFLPDKAIDLLDEAGSWASLTQSHGSTSNCIVTVTDIQHVISSWTGIPVTGIAWFMGFPYSVHKPVEELNTSIPELLDSKDEVVVFKQPTIYERLKQKDIKPKVTKKRKELSVTERFHERFRVNSLRQGVSRLVEYNLAKKISAGAVKEGDASNVDIDTKGDEVFQAKSSRTTDGADASADNADDGSTDNADEASASSADKTEGGKFTWVIENLPSLNSMKLLSDFISEDSADKTEGGKFTWKIENFSAIKSRELRSDVFIEGDCKWQILIFPRGYAIPGYLSVFLSVADRATQAPGWSICVDCSLAVIDQISGNRTVIKKGVRMFGGRRHTSGFPEFMSRMSLSFGSRGYLVNDTCIIEAKVKVLKRES